MEQKKRTNSARSNFNFCMRFGCSNEAKNGVLCDEHTKKRPQKQPKKGTKTPPKSSLSEYKIYYNMKQRCFNPNSNSFKNYGLRGIKVCERWKESFDNFYQDMGPRPSIIHSLDRIDNEGNYEPGNCRWSTSIEQSNNTRVSKGGVYWNTTKKCWSAKMEHNGKNYNLGDFGFREIALRFRQKAFWLAKNDRANEIKHLEKPYTFIKELRAWQTLMRSAYSPNKQIRKRFEREGITVCASWSVKDNLEGFKEFVYDMGQIEHGKNKLCLKQGFKEYNKTNCFWY